MPRPSPAACGLALLLSTLTIAADIDRVDIQHGDTQWRAVIVPADKALAYTGLAVTPDSPMPESTGLGSPEEHAAMARRLHLFNKVNRLTGLMGAYLRDAGTDAASVVKLNVYASRPDDVPTIRTFIEKAFPAAAISYVVTPLPDGALIAADAVAVVTPDAKPTPNASILRPGGATFISGQAEKGKDLAEATKLTMAGLGRTLEHLGLTKKDAVQLKCFFKPMSDVAAARREIDAFFAPEIAPPVSWVETTQNTTNEIEMVAQAPPPRKLEAAADTIEFITPPWFKPSPVYCKVTVVRGGRLIFTSGLYASKADLPGEDEVKDIYTGLLELMTKAGTDFKHLAKATYYPSAEPPSTALNKLRATYYDPQRPPAASKMMIHHTGVDGRGLTMDIIAVTPK